MLKILYPEKHYTRANYTSSPWLDPLSGDLENVVTNLNLTRYNDPVVEESYPRENATFFSLVRNNELYKMLQSIRQLEDRFNKRYHYDWIFANDEEFTDTFKAEVSNMVSGKSTFVLVPKEYWSYPDWIDQEKAAATRKKMKIEKVIYGESESYRHMCRFNSGFFHKLKAFDGIKYYWRVEPNVKFSCDLPYDFFKYMRENQLKYGWTMSLHEIGRTIDGLFEATKEFFSDLHPEYVAKENQVPFITNDGGLTYNLCHYWSNFEIGDLDFLRSKQYEEYFQHLDKNGGFFYERWGDAPVHTLAVSYLLNKTEVHYFDNTGYSHAPHSQCPRDVETRAELHCTCQVSSDFNRGNGDSCLRHWFDTRQGKRTGVNRERPTRLSGTPLKEL